MEGVNRASVNFATETAYVEYDEKVTSKKALWFHLFNAAILRSLRSLDAYKFRNMMFIKMSCSFCIDII